MFLICALFIENNHQTNLFKLFKSIEDKVDGFIVLDTSEKSVDTVDIYFNVCDKYTEYHKSTFIDYTTSRNELLTYCRNKSKYILLLDGGDEVIHPECINFDLVDDLYTCNSNRGPIPYIVKNNILIHYKYPVYEQIVTHKGDRNNKFLNTSLKIQKHDEQNYSFYILQIKNYLQRNNCFYMRFRLCQAYFENEEYTNSYLAALDVIKYKDHTRKYREEIYRSYLFAGLCLYYLNIKCFRIMFYKAYEYKKSPEPFLILSDCFYREKYINEAKKYINIACS